MDLRPMCEVAPPAYLGSWALVMPTVQDMVGGAPILGIDAPPAGTKMAVAQAKQDWRTLTNRPRTEPVDWTAVAASRGIPKQQRVISQALDRGRRRRLESSADPEDWMRVQSCAEIWASVWLTVTPTGNGLSFLDAEYAVLVRFRLRLPLAGWGSMRTAAAASFGHFECADGGGQLVCPGRRSRSILQAELGGMDSAQQPYAGRHPFQTLVARLHSNRAGGPESESPTPAGCMRQRV